MADIINVTPDAALPSTGEATMQDLQLAEKLGYTRPTNFRKLIVRHRASLEALGSLLHRGAMIETAKGAKRGVTEFHLTKAQAAFLVAKAGTKEADSALILISEAFAMLVEGKLVAVDEAAKAELDAAAARAAERHRLMREEKDARYDALKRLKASSSGPAVTPWEKRREEELKARRRQSRWAAQARKYANPGDPT